MKRLIIAFVCCVAVVAASAQIGYQVSLLNNATGEPRANERVTVTVKIIDSNGNVLCNETKNATTNDFGVISLSVGNGIIFSNADWTNLPFYIEATVDNRLIGKSKLLSVPVAEYAKHTGSLTKEHLCSKSWIHYYDNGNYRGYYFDENGTYIKRTYDAYYGDIRDKVGTYVIEGYSIFIFSDSQCTEGYVLKYCKEKDCIYDYSAEYYYK